MDIAVIGAGASGVMAALEAAKSGGRVCLIDHNPTIGKKLLVTGSGRCNLSNGYLTPTAYTCADPNWIKRFLDAFPLSSLLEVLEQLGIPVHHTDDGWYYPLSDSAHSIVSILSEALHHRGIEMLLSTQVVDYFRDNGRFVVLFPSGEPARTRSFDRLVVAAGGKAYPALGSRGELFPSVRHLGHTVIPLVPALGPLMLNMGGYKALQGVRLDVGTAIYAGSDCLGRSKGNVIFTSWGINGPGAMNLSHLAARWLSENSSQNEKDNLVLELDLLAYFEDLFFAELTSRRKRATSLRGFLQGFYIPKVSDFLLRQMEMEADLPIADLTEEQMEKLVQSLKRLRIAIISVGSFDKSQLSAGGVPVFEVEPETCQSLRVPGLFLVGETLDVVGPCGGFNLHFAFGSGILAGRHLAAEL